MGKGGSGSSDNAALQQGQLQDANALTSIATAQQNNSQSLFNSSFPGFNSAENFYASLSSGDPGKIAAASAPAIQQVNAATTSAKQNILNNSPNGGEKNLALEQTDVARGAKVGDITSGGYLNSFNALAQLAGQGVGESTSAAGTGISGFNSAAGVQGNVVQQNIQEKGAQLGALTSLGTDAATLGAAFI